MDRLELTKVEIHSVSWEKGGGKRLSGAVAKRKFLGPKLEILLGKEKKDVKSTGGICLCEKFQDSAFKKQIDI